MEQKLFELLKREHRQVEKWLTQIEDAPERNREEIFTTLQDALEKHMQLEEKLFYPQLKKIKELKELGADALEAHEKVKNLLSLLEDLDVDDDDWISTFSELQQGVALHVQDEEKKIFPGCTQFMSAQLLRDIGEQCTEEKESATSSRSVRRGQKSKR